MFPILKIKQISVDDECNQRCEVMHCYVDYRMRICFYAAITRCNLHHF